MRAIRATYGYTALAMGGYRDKYLSHPGGLHPLRIIGN